MIDYYINKLQLQEQLYEKPTDPCDLARQLIEQVYSTLKATKISLPQLKPLLAEIGHCLAPDDFLVILNHDISVESNDIDNSIQSRATKTAAWENVLSRLTTYLKRSGNINDRVKMSLWADLVKLARTTQLWDICRVACCFATLYDDGRWKNHFQVKTESFSRKGNRGTPMISSQISDNSSNIVESTSVETEVSELTNGDVKTRKREESDLTSNSLPGKSNRFEKMLIEMISDIHIIRAEAIIQGIRNEGAELFTIPERPRDFKKHPKGYVRDTSKEDVDWKNYCDCLQRMSDSVVNCFIRSATLSIELQSPWILQNAATYLWNYSIHVISLSEHSVIVSCFQIMFDFMRQMVNEKMVDIITQYGVILSHGIIQKLIPTSPAILNTVFEVSTPRSAIDKKVKKGKESPKLKGAIPTGLQNQIDNLVQYKKALEICQYLMDITADVATIAATEGLAQTQINSTTISKPLSIGKLVDLQIKYRLIEIWVQCKQMLQQSIGATLGTDDLDNKMGQRTQVRVITAVQMLWISQNDFYKFSDAPNVEECIRMIEKTEWQQCTVVLDLLMKLCFVTMNNGGTISIVNKIVETASKHCSIKKAADGSLAMSYLMFCQGICLHKNSSAYSSILIECLKVLVQACCYASEAKNYILVSQISHYFWNISQTIIERSSGGGQITVYIESIINCIVKTVDKKRLKLLFEPHTEEELPRIEYELEDKLQHNILMKGDQKMISVDYCKTLFQSSYNKLLSKSSMEQDLILRIQMTVEIYLSYFSKEKWQEALKVLDNAIADLPRTNHRMVLFKHKVLCKVRLGQSIEMDIQRFKNQEEHEVSLLWREVSLWSDSQSFQLQAYENAINVLKLRQNDWLKAELVMELAQWMLHCNFPIDVCDQLVEWAIDILLNIEFKNEDAPEKNTNLKKRTRSTSSKRIKLQINAQSDIIESKDQPNDINVPEDMPDSKQPVQKVPLQPYCPTKISDLGNVHQLSALFISFVFRAKIFNTADLRFRESILMACACISQIWMVSMKNVASVIREISKSKSDSDSPSKSKDKKDKDKRDKTLKTELDQTKSKVIKRKGPIDWIPSSLEDWAIFEVSDEVLEALTSMSYMPVFGINSTSIKNLGEFVAYCDILVDILEHQGYDLLVFPILSLMDLLSRSNELVPAKVMNQYVHLRCFQMSLRLHLSLASSHHERFIDTPSILPESFPYEALLETTVRKYKQNQDLMAKTSKFPLHFQECQNTYLNVTHLSRKYASQGFIHDTWTKIGAVLIHLGYNKEATEVLEVTEKVAELLEDKNILIDINLLKSRLMLNTGEVKRAVHILDNVEENFSSFSFNQWKEVASLFYEISTNISSRYNDVEMFKTRLIRFKEHTEKRLLAINFINQETQINSLRTSFDYYIILMEITLLEKEYQEDLAHARKSNKNISRFILLDSRLGEIEASYKSMDDISSLSKVMTTKVQVYDMLLKLATDRLIKIVTLKKLTVIEELLSLEIVNNNIVHQICQTSQEKSCSLPVDRKLARIQLLLSDCLLDMYSASVDKKVMLTLQHRQKPQLQQIVDEYVADSIPEEDSLEWSGVQSTICDRLLCVLSDAHSRCKDIIDINAKILSRYGNVLKLRAMEIQPLNDEQWNNTMNGDISKQNNADNESLEYDKDIQIESSLEYRNKIIKTQTKLNLLQSNEYLSQATELLNQALHLSITCHDYDLASYVIMLLVDILGQFEASTSVHLLCLYQNCRASLALRHTLYSTLREAPMGELAALILQYNYLRKQSESSESNLTSSTIYRSVTDKLNNNFTAWKVTNVTINQSDLLKDISAMCTDFCIIQHSQDSKYVYSAFIDAKQKSSNTARQGNKQSTGDHSAKAADKSAIYRMKTSSAFTQTLKNTWKSYKLKLEDAVYDIEKKRMVTKQKEKLYIEINSQKDMVQSLDVKDQLCGNINLRLLKLDKQFSELCHELSEYLSPILEPLYHLLPSNTSRNTSSRQKNATQPTMSKDSLILLIDNILLNTSMESLKYFKCPLSRDFSLQILHHRFKIIEKGEVDVNDSGQTTDSSKKKEKSKIPHRIPILRDVSKRSVKVLALNRQIPTGSISLDTHQFRYVVDPDLDTNNLCEQSLSIAFKKELSLSSIREQQITPRWIGLIGEDYRPSVEEIELYIKDASSFIYLNTENIVSLLTPQRIAMLNSTDLQFICCMDRMENRTFKDRMVQKSRSNNYIDVISEDFSPTIQLLTLAGSRSMVCSQYCGLTEWTLREMRRLFSFLFDEGQCLCESVYSMRSDNIEKTESSDTNENKNEDNSYSGTNGNALGLALYNPVMYGLPTMIVNSSS